jgi:hypothetical protein
VYRAALAKRAVIRDAIVGVLDSLRLDVLLYPTMRRKPAFIGDPQQGTTCALSSQSGLPALSAPVGFSADGLPIGIELIGRPWADARLVALAYAFEQTGARRRPPSTTPSLVNGSAPRPIAFTTVARAGSAAVEGRFTFDQTRHELAFDARVTGARPETMLGVVLVRRESARAGHVVHRLAAPGAMSATGTIFLDGIERRALHEGRLGLSIVTSDDATGTGNAILTLPSPAR